MHDNFEQKKLANMMRNRSVIVDILAMVFGIGTWVGINATFIQLPILVENAPEGWSLPSYLSVMVQIGNLGPLAYTLAMKYTRMERKFDSGIIYGLLTMGAISALLTAFFYNRITDVFGEPHSLALFILTIFTAINACTSSVLFMPYMGRFKELYLTTYFVGEGLSGLLPSIVALIQGIESDPICVPVKGVNGTNGQEVFEKYTPPPRFGTMEFFLFVFAMMVCSFVAFTLLHKLRLARNEYARNILEKDDSSSFGGSQEISERNNWELDNTSIKDRNETAADEEISKIPHSRIVFLLALICVISFFSNGIFNSIQSYSCLPYGGSAYHLSATLSVIANPVACFLAIFLPHTSFRAILSLSGVAGLLTIYVFVTALMSPLPPLHDHVAGGVIVIIVWTTLIGVISYAKLSISTVMRAQGGKALIWTGALTQLGSLFGSILIFILINFTNSFQAAYNDELVC